MLRIKPKYLLITIIVMQVIITTVTINKKPIIKNNYIQVNETIQVDTIHYVLKDVKNNDFIDKYLDKLPHREIQVKAMNKYEIPLETGILINFIESNFSKDISLTNKCYNKVGGTDYGSMQINSKFHPIIKKHVDENDLHSYYDYAYKHLKRMMTYSKKKDLRNHEQLTVLCWNSKTPSQQAIYESHFLKRANKELKQMYGRRIY